MFWLKMVQKFLKNTTNKPEDTRYGYLFYETVVENNMWNDDYE
jgi:hypothetical protein